MMTVGVDRAVVETALLGGELGCPVLGCPGRLAPWGWARGRMVRGEGGAARLRPRRSRCRNCLQTHVLLPASVLLRRADEVTVIGAGLLAKAGGCGHRQIATRLGRAASTVRGWLRRIGAVADPVLGALGVLAAELGGEFLPPAPTAEPVAAVVEMVGALARAAVGRLGGSCSPWRLAAVLCGGRLLSPHGPDLLRAPPETSNTSWLWAAGGEAGEVARSVRSGAGRGHLEEPA